MEPFGASWLAIKEQIIEEKKMFIFSLDVNVYWRTGTLYFWIRVHGSLSHFNDEERIGLAGLPYKSP